MPTESLSFIFLNAVLANNFVLALFLGLCPFLGVSGKLDTALPMGLATMFVMLVSSVCAFAINQILVTFDIEFLRLIAYIAVIASAVQLVEMTLKKFTPGAVPLPRHLPATDHHQLRDPWPSTVPDLQGVRLSAVASLCDRCRYRLHSRHPTNGRTA